MFLIFCFVLISHTMNGMKPITPAQMHNTSVHRINGISFKFNKIKKTSLKVFAHNSELFLWTFNTSGSWYRRQVGTEENRSNRKYLSVLFLWISYFSIYKFKAANFTLCDPGVLRTALQDLFSCKIKLKLSAFTLEVTWIRFDFTLL